MRVDVYGPSVVITSSHKEYNILLHAILLLELSSIGIEESIEKIHLIEKIKHAMQNINVDTD